MLTRKQYSQFKINFIKNLDQAGEKSISFIIEEAKESVLNVSQGTVKVLYIYFDLI